jgi:hypothetical protein
MYRSGPLLCVPTLFVGNQSNSKTIFTLNTSSKVQLENVMIKLGICLDHTGSSSYRMLLKPTYLAILRGTWKDPRGIDEIGDIVCSAGLKSHALLIGSYSFL